MKHPALVITAAIISIAATAALPEKDMNNARGVFGVFLGGQTLRACHCKCGLASEDQKRKVGQGLGGLFPGLNQGLVPRMVGGVILEPHKLPWLAIVVSKGVITAMGALISDRHVLTAASPLINATAADVKVTLGAHDRCILDNSGNYSISSIILHPNFDFSTRAHDLALLRLSNFISFNRQINPICLPTILTPYKGQHVTVASWANVNPPPATDTYNCVPKRLSLPILSQEDCSKSITTSSLLTSDKNCIGLVGSSSVICSIDAGAPVQYKVATGHFELIGILTNANVCNVVNSTLFVRVHDHLQWIKEHIRPDCSCGKF